jgi:hypothetical protein
MEKYFSDIDGNKESHTFSLLPLPAPHTPYIAEGSKRVILMTSLVVYKGVLISLWLYKEHNKLQD